MHSDWHKRFRGLKEDVGETRGISPGMKEMFKQLEIWLFQMNCCYL